MGTKAKQVNEIFASWDRQDTPGCALAVMKDGEITFKKGYGIANLEYDIPITPETIFHVASISKQFTAMAIVLLANEEKISLDDDVRKYVPEIPDFGEIITLRHLIHHTSGLRDQWDLLKLAGWRMDDVITKADVLELLESQKELCFQPGEEFLYCNTGYTLLAVIVERVSGRTFPQFCAERMFKPLKMRNSHFHDDHTKIVKNRAYSYAPKEKGYKHSVLSFAIAGATSLFTTVEDLALWEQNFYDARVGGQEVIHQMHQQGFLNNGEKIGYAFGLAIEKYRGWDLISHSGGDAGYRSFLMRLPDHHLSIAILSNLSTVNPLKLSKKVADVYLAGEFQEENEEATDKLLIGKPPPEQLSSKAGLYYSAEKARTYRLEMRKRKLVVVIGPGLELEPLSEELFRVVEFPGITFNFKSTEKGERQVNIVQRDGKPDIYVAVDTVDPSTDEMQKYVGDYYSPELQVGYSIILEKEKLLLKRRKYGESQLFPTFRDGFISDLIPGEGSEGGLDLKFFRDNKNQVCGFRISTGRARNLLFMRQ